MFFRDAKTCSDDRSAAAFLTIIFTSQFPVKLCLFSRKYSRQTRLILLRVAACPTFFVTVSPRRDLSKWPGEKIAIKYWFSTFLPALDNRRKSRRFKILSALVNVKKRTPSFLPLQSVLLIYYCLSLRIFLSYSTPNVLLFRKKSDCAFSGNNLGNSALSKRYPLLDKQT